MENQDKDSSVLSTRDHETNLANRIAEIASFRSTVAQVYGERLARSTILGESAIRVPRKRRVTATDTTPRKHSHAARKAKRKAQRVARRLNR